MNRSTDSDNVNAALKDVPAASKAVTGLSLLTNVRMPVTAPVNTLARIATASHTARTAGIVEGLAAVVRLSDEGPESEAFRGCTSMAGGTRGAVSDRAVWCRAR